MYVCVCVCVCVCGVREVGREEYLSCSLGVDEAHECAAGQSSRSVNLLVALLHQTLHGFLHTETVM